MVLARWSRDEQVAGFELVGYEMVEAGTELIAVIGENTLKLPAGVVQVLGDSAGELTRLGGAGIACGAHNEVGPAVT